MVRGHRWCGLRGSAIGDPLQPPVCPKQNQQEVTHTGAQVAEPPPPLGGPCILKPGVRRGGLSAQAPERAPDTASARGAGSPSVWAQPDCRDLPRRLSCPRRAHALAGEPCGLTARPHSPWPGPHCPWPRPHCPWPSLTAPGPASLPLAQPHCRAPSRLPGADPPGGPVLSAAAAPTAAEGSVLPDAGPGQHQEDTRGWSVGPTAGEAAGWGHLRVREGQRACPQERVLPVWLTCVRAHRAQGPPINTVPAS